MSLLEAIAYIVDNIDHVGDTIRDILFEKIEYYFTGFFLLISQAIENSKDDFAGMGMYFINLLNFVGVDNKGITLDNFVFIFIGCCIYVFVVKLCIQFVQWVIELVWPF